MIEAVRKDYERVVAEVQTVDGLSLASECVHWPRNTLCLPQFLPPHQLNKQLLMLTNTEEPIALNNTEESLSPADISSSHIEGPILSTQAELLCTHEQTLKPSNAPVETPSPADLFPELPKSKEGLLELRAQLSMELLWLRQAITSRQTVSDHLLCKLFVITIQLFSI